MDTSTTHYVINQFNARLQAGDAETALAILAEAFIDQDRYHELFELRKLQLRRAMGLSILPTQAAETLSAERQAEFDRGLIAACREVGEILLNAGRLREAWTFLQAVDDRQAVRQLIRSVEFNDQTADDLIEVAIHEGVDPVQGLIWMLERHGTCNAITTYDSCFMMFALPVRRGGAEKLAVHLHDELKTSLRAHIQREQPAADTQLDSISDMLEKFPWVTAEGMRHLDESHLAAVVRIGRIATAPQAIHALLHLTNYGMNLQSDYASTGDSPFDELYPDSHLFYQALDGVETAAAINHFQNRADVTPAKADSTATAEWYIYLLSQLGKTDSAIDESIRLLGQHGVQLGIAPTLLELCHQEQHWQRVQQFFCQRDRILEYAVARLSQGRRST